MPIFHFSQALTANQLNFNPLTGWQYEFLPFPAHCKVLVNATTVGVRITVYTGSETIVQRSPVGAGATAGVFPNELSNPAIVFMGAERDRLILQLDEVAGGTPTVNGVVYVEPAI